MRALPFVLLYLIPAATSTTLSIYGWRRRSYEGAAIVSMLMAAIAFWSVCHAFSAGSSALRDILFWAQVQYIGIVMVPPLFLLFALAHANQAARATPPVRLVLIIPPALALLAVWTNDWHFLWWTRVAVDPTRAFGSLDIGHGVLFWLWFAYTYICVLLGLGLFVQTMLETTPLYRQQARLVVIGALFPIVGNIAYLAGLQISFVDDPTPFLFAVSGITFFYAAQRYRLFDLGPIAQREIYESMPDGVVVLDTRHVVLSLNNSARQILGVADGALVGQPLADALATGPLAGEVAALLARPDDPAPRALSYHGADGMRGVELRLRSLRVRRNHVGSMLVLRDTTELERTQEALRRRLTETTLLQQIARTTNAVAQTDDVLRSSAGAILDALAWDRVAIALLRPGGAPLRLVVDQPRDDTPSYVGSELADETIAMALEGLKAGVTRVSYVDDGDVAGTPAADLLGRLGVSTSVLLPLTHQDRPLGVLFIGAAAHRPVPDDERQLLETIAKLVSESVLRAQLYDEADQANRLKATFLATVSHELRTPLSSVIGYADMLQRGLFGPLPPAMDEPIGNILRGGQGLQRLINDMLDFSRMEAGYFDVELFPVDAAAVARSVATLIQPQVRERGLELRLAIVPDLPLVRADAGRLEQVVTNLAINAIKFTDSGAVTIAVARAGERVRISVSDTGIGIPPEQLGEIFQAFRQIEGPQTRRYGGAGLGLAIARRLVELMGGTVGVESAPGRGSTFWCDLRIANHAPGDSSH